MKIKLLSILLVFSVFCTYAQKRKNKSFYTGGAVAPFSDKYIDYLTYTPKFVYTPKLKSFYEERKLPFDPNKFMDQAMEIGGGLKNKPSGDFKVTFELEDFQFVDFGEVDGEKSMIIGLKANVTVYDKEDQLIFSRYLAPITKSYVYNKSLKLNASIDQLLKYTYDKLIKEFNYYYTFGPQIYTNVINLTDIKDLPELAEFESSVDVFEALKDIKRSEQAAVLDGVIGYWKPFLKYAKIKDKDHAMDLRLAANYNTAMALILQNKFTEAEKMMPAVKANDRTMLGMTLRDMELKSVISSVKSYQLLSKDFKLIQPIEEPNTTKDYAFENIVFNNASVIYGKDDMITGNVKLIFDNPIFEYLPGWNSNEMTSNISDNKYIAATQIAGGLLKLRKDFKTEDSNVLVEIAGKKKPKKLDLSEIVSIKTEKGETYKIEVMGFGDGKRYAAVKEINSCSKITLYQEVFPGNELLFKRNGKEDAFQLKPFSTDKKEFKKFFSDCPRMHAMIELGEFASADANAYKKFMDEYMKLCCPPLKKK